MKRSEFLHLAAAAPLALLTGCAAQQAEPAAVKHRVVMIVKSTKTSFWKTAFAGAQTAATEYNVSLSITGPETEENYEAQNTMIAQAVKNRAEAILISAIDYEKNAESINAAADAGIKIIAIDSDVDSDRKETYIGTDNYAAGQMAARAVLDCGYETIKLGLINYGASSKNGQEREQGLRDALADAKNVEIVAAINTTVSAEFSESDAAQMLREHPEINALAAFNESVAVGAGRALRVMGTGDKIWLVGFDSNVETINMLQTGEVNALIVQNPYAMGYLGVESAALLLSGQKTNLEEIVDTAAQTVNRNNMFTPESQKILFSFN